MANIMVNGIIDVIKELKETAKCPFCDGKLGFLKAGKPVWGSGDVFQLSCDNCKLEFGLRKRKKDKWILEQVRARDR